MSYIIETSDLTKRFPQQKSYLELFLHPFRRKMITALEGVDVHVRKGELFGVLGPNGAGKTTLLKILCTLVLPNEGKASVNGYDVTKDGKQIRKSIGLVIREERSFYWRLTGRQNLKFFATLNNMSSADAKRRIDEVVTLTGLEDDIEKVFKEYSSGMKQKLALARGMLTNPEILFLDEPTTNLDPIVTREIRKFVKEQIVGKEQKTVVLATNNMKEAEELCDRVAIMHRGRVRICDSLDGIRRALDESERFVFKMRNSREYLEQKFSDSFFDGKVSSLAPEPASDDGDLLVAEINTNRDNIAETVEKMVTAGIQIEACYPMEASLDELFARIIE